MPGTLEAFMRLVEAGWDTEASPAPTRAAHHVVVHVDVDARAAALHLGPLLTDTERRYLTCDASCEVWFERDGQVIGAGRTTRQINRRLRRALDTASPCARFPAVERPAVCTHTTSWHWEDGGAPIGQPVWYARITTGTPPGRHHHHRTRRPISSSPTAPGNR